MNPRVFLKFWIFIFFGRSAPTLSQFFHPHNISTNMEPIDVEAIMREFDQNDDFFGVEQMFEGDNEAFFEEIAGDSAFMDSFYADADDDFDFALALSLSDQNDSDDSDVVHVPKPKGKGKKRERDGSGSGSSSKNPKSSDSGAGSGSGATDKTCSICLCEMTKKIARLPCMHAFHKGCISRWKRGECPVCRIAFRKGEMMVS